MDRDANHIASLLDRILERLRPAGRYRLDHREVELRPPEARRVLERLAGFVHERFSYVRFLEKLAHVLGMARDGARGREEREILENAAGFFLAGIARALEEEGGEGRVLGFSGELSGIFEVATKRGTVFQAIDIRGDEDEGLRGLEFVDMSIRDAEGQTVKEFDAVSQNAVFEFKFNATLKKLYEQVLGLGDRRSHVELLARDPRFDRIRNLVYFGENAGGGGEIARAITSFARRRGIPCERSDRGGIAVRLTLDAFRAFIRDGETLRLLRREASALADGWRWGVDLEHLEESRELEDVDRLLEALDRSRRGEKFDVIIALSNCPRDDARCAPSGG